MSIKEEFTRFGQKTSIKGVAKILQSDKVYFKCLWLLAFFCGLAIGLYQVSLLLMKYFSFATVTKVSICTGCHPPFPDVTLCNSNPLGLFEAFEQEHPGELMLYKEYRDIIKNLEKELGDDNGGLLYGELYTLTGYFLNINITRVYEFLFNRKDIYNGLVHECEWYDWQDRYYRKEYCRVSSKYFISSPEYFLCTTIHMNDTNKESSNTEVKGFDALLYLDKFSEFFMSDYTQHLLRSQASGVKVIIHPPNTFPDISSGINIPPGHEVEVKLKANKIKRLSYPYSDCTDRVKFEQDIDVSPVPMYFVNHRYSSKIATLLCKQEYFIKTCKCFNPYLPITRFLLNKFPQVTACTTSIELYNKGTSVWQNDINMTRLLNNMDCFLFHNENENIDKVCMQKEQCSEYNFEYDVHQSPWPDEAYVIPFYCQFIHKEMCTSFTSSESFGEFHDHFESYYEVAKNGSVDDSLGYKMLQELHQKGNLIRNNFIQLKVLFSASAETTYEDVPAVTLDVLFGTLGGLLNLWIGFTFFTIMEMVELLFLLMIEFYKRKNSNAVTEKTSECLSTK